MVVQIRIYNNFYLAIQHQNIIVLETKINMRALRLKIETHVLAK